MMGHSKLLLIDDDCWQSSKSLNHDKLLLLLGPITRMPQIPRIVYYDYEDHLMERLRKNKSIVTYVSVVLESQRVKSNGV